MESENQKRKKKRILVSIVVIITFVISIFLLTRKKETVPEYVFTYAENQTADYPTTMGGKHFA